MPSSGTRSHVARHVPNDPSDIADTRKQDGDDQRPSRKAEPHGHRQPGQGDGKRTGNDAKHNAEEDGSFQRIVGARTIAAARLFSTSP